MTVYELALLGNMSAEAVINSISSSNRYKLTRTPDKPASLGSRDAVHWLRDRKGFCPTHLPKTDQAHLIEVPQAGDGSLFDTSCKRRNGYQIGKKGSEEYIADFEKALAKLRSMPIASWRRPAIGTGRFGLVQCRQWVRKSRLDLGLEKQ
jgi:hypothetical protein